MSNSEQQPKDDKLPNGCLPHSNENLECSMNDNKGTTPTHLSKNFTGLVFLYCLEILVWFISCPVLFFKSSGPSAFSLTNPHKFAALCDLTLL
jgi:hypothetical protein